MRASGLGFLSSLNEVFMCFQRVEMNLYGIEHFRDIPSLLPNPPNGKKQQQPRLVFASRFVIGLELYFKFAIFCIIPFFSFKALCDMDISSISFLTGEAATAAAEATDYSLAAMFLLLASLLSSPNCIRGGIFRIFMLTMYPSMGKRTLKKIEQYHNHQPNQNQQQQQQQQQQQKHKRRKKTPQKGEISEDALFVAEDDVDTDCESSTSSSCNEEFRTS